MQQTINKIVETQSAPGNFYYLKTDGVAMIAASNETFTSFVGVANNEDFNRSFNEEPIDLLIQAVNNRTRERNYFRLLTKYLEQEICDEEFEKEIEENENLYVVDTSINPTDSQLRNAANLSKRIIGIDSPDDFMSLFSFSEYGTVKLLGLENE